MGDTLQTIVDLLKDNWLLGNSDGITPEIDKIYNKKRVGGMTDPVTFIGVYPHAGANLKPIDLGYNNVSRDEHVSIDIRSSQSHEHLINCEAEARRIINANRKTVSGFDVAIVVLSKDISEGTRKFWHWVLEVDLIAYAEAVA